MPAIDVQWDFGQFSNQLRAFTRKQVPFATARALTMTVVDARDQLISDLPKVFTIRNKWTERGMRIQQATKSSLVALVGSTRDYMALQATGGTKVAGAKKLGLPVKARPKKTSRITPPRFPRAVIAKGGFVRRMAGKPSAVFALPRKSRGTGKRKRRPKLRLMYYLLDRIEVPQRWDLEGTLRKTAKREWISNMRQAWRKAMATRRRK